MGYYGIFPEGTRKGLLKTGEIKKGSILIGIYNEKLMENNDKEKAEIYVNELLKKEIISLSESDIYENIK